MTRFTNLPSVIASLYEEYGEKWSGYLFRAGGRGIFYHTVESGAEYYGNDVKKFECPITVNGIAIDLDSDYEKIAKLSSQETEDIALAIEDSVIPALRRSGYDCIVINGETGTDVTGTPVEVVLFDAPKSVIDRIADEMNDPDNL